MIEDLAPGPTWFWPSVAFAFGLILGSFVNVLIHRLPRGQSVVWPRSRCPRCGEEIAAYDNVPVASYLLLGGRCRRCRARISLRYPLVELLVAGASLASFLRHGPSLEYAVEIGFVASMVALVFIDFDHQILPNAITYPGILAGLALSVPRESLSFGQSAAGALLGGGLLWLVAEVYFRFRKIEGLGMGDVKMMAMVGAFLGWKAVLLTIFVGSLLGSLVGLMVMLFRGGGMQSKLPLGTFLGAAATFSLFLGAPFVDWYASLAGF